MNFFYFCISYLILSNEQLFFTNNSITIGQFTNEIEHELAKLANQTKNKGYNSQQNHVIGEASGKMTQAICHFNRYLVDKLITVKLNLLLPPLSPQSPKIGSGQSSTIIARHFFKLFTPKPTKFPSIGTCNVILIQNNCLKTIINALISIYFTILFTTFVILTRNLFSVTCLV